MSELKLSDGETVMWKSRSSFLPYSVQLIFPLLLGVIIVNYFIINFVPSQYFGAFIFTLVMFNLPSILLLGRIFNYFTLSYFITNKNLIIRRGFSYDFISIADIKRVDDMHTIWNIGLESNLLAYTIEVDKKFSESDGLFRLLSRPNSRVVHGYYRLIGIKEPEIARKLLSLKIEERFQSLNANLG